MHMAMRPNTSLQISPDRTYNLSFNNAVRVFLCYIPSVHIPLVSQAYFVELTLAISNSLFMELLS